MRLLTFSVTFPLAAVSLMAEGSHPWAQGQWLLPGSHSTDAFASSDDNSGLTQYIQDGSRHPKALNDGSKGGSTVAIDLSKIFAVVFA